MEGSVWEMVSFLLNDNLIYLLIHSFSFINSKRNELTGVFA